MKIKDVIVEQEKPGLLRRAAGALGRGAYALTTGEFYPDPDLTPIEQIAKSATKNRSAVIKDAILQMQKRKIDTPEKFTQFYQAYFGGENPKLQASIQKKLQDLGRIDPNDTATVQQAITALTDERIKTLSKLAKGEFEPTEPQQPSTQIQQPTQQTAQTTVPVQQGYRTAVIVPTGAGDRKFWYDGKNWREHFGRDWPNDLETSQVVADPTTVQFLSKQVQLKNIQQIPYGPRPKNKKKS